MGGFRRLLHGISELAFPSLCPGCGAPASDHRQVLCARCLDEISVPNLHQLNGALLHLPLPAGIIDDVFALWTFEKGGPVQRVQHALKYGNRPRYGRRLGQEIGAALISHLPPIAVPIVVPIPLHRQRLVERGYNQAGELAWGIADELGLKIEENALRRTRKTRSQTGLHRTQRWQNVTGAFEASSIAVAGMHVLLVDDVLTTGATCAAGALALHQAGARSIRLVMLAYAQHA